MSGTEVGVGYVSLVPSAKGFGAAVAAELGPQVEAAAATTGASASKSLSSNFLGGLNGISAKTVGLLGFAGVGIAAFKSAEDVENAQNIILRATGATGKAADSLEQSFKNVAATTPASFQTVATTLGEVYQRTGLTGKALEGLTSQVVTFNRITKDSPIEVQSLTQALAGFNVPGAQMGRVLDQLFTTSQKTGVPLADLVNTLNTAGPVARQFGFSVQFTAGLMAQLNKAGVDTNTIMPGLRRAFIQFAKDGKEPAAALKDTLGQMDALLKKGDEAQARQLAVQLFGSRGVGLVDAAIQGKLSLQSLGQTFDTTGKGILATASSTATLSGKLGVLKNQAMLAFAEFGTPILDAGTDALKSLIPVTTAVGKGLSAIQPAIEPAILAFGAFYGTSKLLVPLLGLVTRGVESLALSLAGLDAERSFAATSALASGLGRLAPALPGIAAGGFLVATSFDQMGKSTGATAQGIIGTTIAGAALGSVIPGVGTAVGGLAGAAIGAGIAFGQWLGQTESLADKLKELDTAAKGVSGSGDDLAKSFISNVIPAAAKAVPDLKGLALTMFAFKSVAAENVGVAARLAQQFPKNSEIYKGMAVILSQLVDKHNAAAHAAESQGDALQQVTGKVDITSDAYKNAIAVFGEWITGIAASTGVTADTLDNIAKQAQTFSQSLDSSIAGATDPFSKFSSQLDVSQQDFEDFFVGSQQRAADWSNEIHGLISAGVDQGILQQIAKAGPDSKPLLDDFVNEVQTHGVDWVNSVFHSSDQARQDTEAAFNAMVVTASIKSAEEATLVKANMDFMNTGSTESLEALLHSSDKTLAAMAYGAILQLGGIQRAVNEIPTSHNVDFTTSNLEAVEASVNGFINTLGQIPGGVFIGLGAPSDQTRASGGPVVAGVPYLVNENTPNSEIFVPSAPGYIYPSGRAPASTASTATGPAWTVNYYGPLDDPVRRTRELAQDMRTVQVLGGW